jgi:hypothetical protein
VIILFLYPSKFWPQSWSKSGPGFNFQLLHFPEQVASSFLLNVVRYLKKSKGGKKHGPEKTSISAIPAVSKQPLLKQLKSRPKNDGTHKILQNFVGSGTNLRNRRYFQKNHVGYNSVVGEFR